jgi:hypothetical protein
MNGIDYNLPETRAAWEMAERAQLHGFTVVQAAELILTATLSPWFAQLQTLASDADPALRNGAQTLITILNGGYDANAKTWFYLPSLYRTPEDLSDVHARLALFFYTLRRRRLTGKEVSPVFDAFGELLFGRKTLSIVATLAACNVDDFQNLFQMVVRKQL